MAAWGSAFPIPEQDSQLCFHAEPGGYSGWRENRRKPNLHCEHPGLVLLQNPQMRCMGSREVPESGLRWERGCLVPAVGICHGSGSCSSVLPTAAVVLVRGTPERTCSWRCAGSPGFSPKTEPGKGFLWEQGCSRVQRHRSQEPGGSPYHIFPGCSFPATNPIAPKAFGMRCARGTGLVDPGILVYVTAPRGCIPLGYT